MSHHCLTVLMQKLFVFCLNNHSDYYCIHICINSIRMFDLFKEINMKLFVHWWPLLFQGGDDVMGCVHDDNGRVRIHHFYNVGQWAKEIKRNPARDEEGIFENNRVTCRFKRPLYVPREETLVDLHLSWYYLFAWGPAIQGEWASFSIRSAVFAFCPLWRLPTVYQQVPSRGTTSTALQLATTWSASISTRTFSCLAQPIKPSILPSAYCS